MASKIGLRWKRWTARQIIWQITGRDLEINNISHSRNKETASKKENRECSNHNWLNLRGSRIIEASRTEMFEPP